MTWAVGVLTWNRAERCRQTITRLVEGLTGDYRLLVLDNGSDPPFTSPIGETIRYPVNQGAGGGMTELCRYLLATDLPYVLFLEDDWTLETPLDLTSLEPVLATPDVGQVRLGVRDRIPSESYWTYGLGKTQAAGSLVQASNRFHDYPGGEYQLVRLLWSNNPWAATAETVRRFCLTGLDEIQMARPYLASGKLTASTTPGHFRHHGAVKERRYLPGWRK